MIWHRNMVKATKAEKERIDMMLSLRWCVCCELAGYDIWRERIEAHHILSGNKRMGHIFTIPACAGHHQGQWSARQLVMIQVEQRIAISDGSKLFTPVYGTPRELWERTQRKLGLPVSGWPVSKILPRRVA